MAKEQFSQEELQQQAGQELPDREAMSLINANLAAPINAAVAANALSDGSIATGDAAQQTDISQSSEPSGPPPLF